MTNRLNYLKDIRGIGVFTARPGMGKSYALRCFANDLNPSLHHMEYMCLSTISVSDFYKQFCSILGVSDKGGKPAMFKAIQTQISYLYKEKRQPLLLAIDEAQYLSTGILNDIKMLMNYGYDSVNCFTLILCGESHLNDILRKPVHEALRLLSPGKPGGKIQIGHRLFIVHQAPFRGHVDFTQLQSQRRLKNQAAVVFPPP